MIKFQLTFLCMALLSGVCSAISLPFSCFLFFAPGVFFGVAIWAALRECGFILTTKATSIVLTLITIAYIAAMFAGTAAEHAARDLFPGLAIARLATAGITGAGLTGAGIVSVTLACVVPQLRSFAQIISTTLAGGVVGAFYLGLAAVFPLSSGSSTGNFPYWSLIVIPLWQVIVAVAIGAFVPLPTGNGSSAGPPQSPKEIE